VNGWERRETFVCRPHMLLIEHPAAVVFSYRQYTIKGKKKVKCFRYMPGVAQRLGTGIALLFHDRGTRRGCVVSSTPRPHFTPGKDQVPIVQEAGWAPGPVWTGGKSRRHGIRSRTIQPVVSSYTDWATRSTTVHYIRRKSRGRYK